MEAAPLSLRHTLGALVALAGCSDAECPHIVVDRQTTVQVTASQACAIRQSFPDPYMKPHPGSLCASACGDPTVTYCDLPISYYGAFSNANVDTDGGMPVCPPGSVALTCQVTHVEGTGTRNCGIAGRRPEGLAPPDETGADASTLGAYFAGCGHLEAASVVAFEVLAAELSAHGAPDTLVQAAVLAGAQERRHVALMDALAARFGASSPTLRVDRRGVRPLTEVARENVVEGVVRETFGAAVALWGATHARDPEVRRALTEIADDECAHASLSWEVAAWASARLSDDERRSLAKAAHQAIGALSASVSVEPARVLCDVAGVPDGTVSARLVALLDAGLWTRSPAVQAG